MRTQPATFNRNHNIITRFMPPYGERHPFTLVLLWSGNINLN
jgi:hypothetical protein